MTIQNGLTSILILALLFVGCSGDSGGGTPATTGKGATAVSVPDAPAKPLLKYRFKVGEKNHYAFSTVAATKTGMGDTSMETIYDVIMEVKNVTPEGAGELHYTYDRARMKMNNPMAGVAEYDSAAENAEEQAQNPLVMAASAMSGAEITLTQHADGRISDLAGMDAVMQKMLDTMGGAGGGVDAAGAAGLLKGMLSDEAWLKSLQSGSVVFPDENPKPGTSWTEARTMPLPMMGEIGMNTTYTYVGCEEKDGTTVGKIDYVSKFDIAGFKPPEPDESNPMSAFLASLKITAGEITGTLDFDMIAGRPMKNSNDLKMTMEMMGMVMENSTQTGVVLVTE